MLHQVTHNITVSILPSNELVFSSLTHIKAENQIFSFSFSFFDRGIAMICIQNFYSFDLFFG